MAPTTLQTVTAAGVPCGAYPVVLSRNSCLLLAFEGLLVRDDCCPKLCGGVEVYEGTACDYIFYLSVAVNCASNCNELF